MKKTAKNWFYYQFKVFTEKANLIFLPWSAQSCCCYQWNESYWTIQFRLPSMVVKSYGQWSCYEHQLKQWISTWGAVNHF